jgi:epoxyqueuosine reductase
MSIAIKKLIKKKAFEIGFNDVRFISTEPLLKSEQKFLEWRKKGFAADMNYLLKENPINARPEYLLEDAKTIIMFSANYYSDCPQRPSPRHGRVAAYATGLDYHKVLRKKIKELIDDIEIKPIFDKSKFFTDAVPLLEKSFAKKAGLGFRGKNSLLISRETGSFNFIAEIITDLDLLGEDPVIASEAKQSPGNDITCGNCIRCSDICPTDALPEPYQLDARKCISYHTIENKGEIPENLKRGFGEWFFGCDLCQTICPYNKKAVRAGTMKTLEEFKPEHGFGHWINLDEILDFETGRHDLRSFKQRLESHTYINNDAEKLIPLYLEKQSEISDEILDHVFQLKFARTPLGRPKRHGLIRNAKIVLENSNSIECQQVHS